MIKDPYIVLGVSHGASLDECKRAYRRLCKVYHPDNVAGGDAVKFDMVSKAYQMVQAEARGLVCPIRKKRSVTHTGLFKFSIC